MDGSSLCHRPLCPSLACKGDHWRRNTGRCQGPQQGQRDTGRGHWPGEPLLTGQHWTLRPAAALPPGAPPATLPRPYTHHISAVGVQAGGTGRHPWGFQGALSSTGSARSIPVSTGPGDSETGPGGVCEGRRGAGGAGPERRAVSMREGAAPSPRPAALWHFLISLSLPLKGTGRGPLQPPAGRRKRML